MPGSVGLLETPAGLRDGRVRSLIIEVAAQRPGSRTLTRGKYKGGRVSEPEDLREAERHGKPGFEDLYGGWERS
jgi:hypothetical protein